MAETFQFGLREVKVGRRTANGTYTTVVDVQSVQAYVVGTETANARLEGNDRITATAGQTIAGQLRLRFGGFGVELLEVLVGSAIESSGATQEHIRVTNRPFPYIGFVGKAMEAEGGGDTHLFVPRAKLAGGFELGFEHSQFSIPELTIDVLTDDYYQDVDGYSTLLIPIWHPTATAVALPPTGIAIFP